MIAGRNYQLLRAQCDLAACSHLPTDVADIIKTSAILWPTSSRIVGQHF